MLKLKKLEMENFGPFKDYQSLEFPDSGIAIVYGENMRGKTRLLNAIRYALFGNVLTRGAREESLHQVGNWEAAEEGSFGFSVHLYFSNDGNDYVLRRSFYPRDSTSEPQSEDDYREEVYLEQNGKVLGPEMMDAELAQIMPEQVSRFFLFDGELLQEYEELLRDDSEMGTKITRAIERILGVPVLMHARGDLRDLYRDAQREASKAAQRDMKTRELGNHLEDLTLQRRSLEDEEDRLKAELRELEERKAILAVELRQHERVNSFLDELDEKQSKLDELEDSLQQRRERLKEVMAGAWRGMLAQPIRQAREQLREEQQHIQQQLFDQLRVDQIEETVRQNTCIVCGQPISHAVSDRLVEDLQALRNNTAEHVDRERLQTVSAQLATLDRFSLTDKSDIVSEIVHSINDLRVESATTRDEIDELEEYVANFDRSEIRAKFAERDQVVEEIGIVKDGLKEERQRIADLNAEIQNLEREIQKLAGPDSTFESRKSALCLSLQKLFTSSVDKYREALRQEVEADATSLFLQLTTEPEYERLSINDNYGLRIVHSTGGQIPVRSAGAEHVVALSLMGALQNNAPLQGPIIMDSPFGRLDAGHTESVIRTLPSMADQVVLLVYRRELSPERARALLQGNLKAEYTLERKSARHTLLQPLME